MVTPAKLLAGDFSHPVERAASSKPKAPKPKHKGTDERRTSDEPAASQAKGGTEKFQRQGPGGGEEKKCLDEILSGFAATSMRQQNRTPAVTSRVRSDGKSARVSARSLCAARCAHGEAARSAPPRRHAG